MSGSADRDVILCKSCGWQAATGNGYCLECAAPETFEDTRGCDMCGAHIDDPCDCFDPQSERRYRVTTQPRPAV